VELKGKWKITVEREDRRGTLNVIRESKVGESITPVCRSFKNILPK